MRTPTLTAVMALLATPCLAGLDLEMNLYVDLDGTLIGPDETALFAVNDTASFVLLAEMSGGPMPALTGCAADFVPVSSCGGENAEVISFEWGTWATITEDPILAQAAILDGSAGQLPAPLGVVDASNPLVVCRFEVQFTGGPERLVYQAVPNGSTSPFIAIANAAAFFPPPVNFDSSVFRSVRVIAVGGPPDDGPCTEADLALPFGVLDLADIQAFVVAFLAGGCDADFRPPWAVLDLADIQAFTTSFVGGCERE